MSEASGLLVRIQPGGLSATVDNVTEQRKEWREIMRRNVHGLLSQFGLSINSDLLAVLIVATAFAASLGAWALLSTLLGAL